MILRRFTQALKDQNWAAIAIEFVLLVLGVFLGIQVANWNEARRNEANEGRYLVELAEDLRADIVECDETVAAARGRVTAARHLLDAAGMTLVWRSPWAGVSADESVLGEDSGNAWQPAEPFVSAQGVYLRWLTNTRVLDGQRNTFDELVSSGNLGVISDRALVRTLTRYYASFEAEQDGDEINRHVQLRLFDYLADHGLNQFDRLPPEQVDVLMETPAFRGQVKAGYDLGMWQVARTLRLKKQAEGALALIAATQKARAPSSTGIWSIASVASTPAARTISTRWPSRPNPVTSVAAWT
jgi:hypothetical protein